MAYRYNGRIGPGRFSSGPPKWPFDCRLELDALEDIFKRTSFQERTLKPALSTILAPALSCAVYATTPQNGSFSVLKKHDSEMGSRKTDLSSIQVHIEHVECDLEETYFQHKKRSRSPGLLNPPIINLTRVKDRLKLPPFEMTADIYVSGCEAERQRSEVDEFGAESASKLAERREAYAKRMTGRDRAECEFVTQHIDIAITDKSHQLQMADELEKQGSFMKDRRAKLWRRCAAMAEVLARDEAEAILCQRRFQEACAIVSGNANFY